VGVSALGLRHALALGAYETAWAWLHKFRRAMVRPDRDRLAGRGGGRRVIRRRCRPGKHGRGAAKKTVVTIAVEKRGRGIGSVRFARVPDSSADSLLAAIEELIEPGSVVATDGHAGYNRIAGALYGQWGSARRRRSTSSSTI
jgi:ISXO2-like transposase domain